MYTGDQDSVGGREFTGLDEEGNPIYGKAPKKEIGKLFNDAITQIIYSNKIALIDYNSETAVLIEN